jgi:hypothetical protein
MQQLLLLRGTLLLQLRERRGAAPPGRGGEGGGGGRLSYVLQKSGCHFETAGTAWMMALTPTATPDGVWKHFL